MWLKCGTILFLQLVSISAQELGQDIDDGASLPTITLQPSDITVNIGSPAAIVCEAGGNPLPVITWYKDGGPVETISENPFSHRVLIRESPARMKLFFHSIIHSKKEKPDVGTYYCNATNSQGFAISRTVRLTVERSGFQLEPSTATWDDAREACAVNQFSLVPGRSYKVKALKKMLSGGQTVWLNGWRAVTDLNKDANGKVKSLKIDVAKKVKKGINLLCETGPGVYSIAGKKVPTNSDARSVCTNQGQSLADLSKEDYVTNAFDVMELDTPYWIGGVITKKTVAKLCLAARIKEGKLTYIYDTCTKEYNYACLKKKSEINSFHYLVSFKMSRYKDFKKEIEEKKALTTSSTVPPTTSTTTTTTPAVTTSTTISSTTTLPPTTSASTTTASTSTTAAATTTTVPSTTLMAAVFTFTEKPTTSTMASTTTTMLETTSTIQPTTSPVISEKSSTTTTPLPTTTTVIPPSSSAAFLIPNVTDTPLRNVSLAPGGLPNATTPQLRNSSSAPIGLPNVTDTPLRNVSLAPGGLPNATTPQLRNSSSAPIGLPNATITPLRNVSLAPGGLPNATTPQLRNSSSAPIGLPNATITPLRNVSLAPGGLPNATTPQLRNSSSAPIGLPNVTDTPLRNVSLAPGGLPNATTPQLRNSSSTPIGLPNVTDTPLRNVSLAPGGLPNATTPQLRNSSSAPIGLPNATVSAPIVKNTTTEVDMRTTPIPSITTTLSSLIYATDKKNMNVTSTSSLMEKLTSASYIGKSETTPVMNDATTTHYMTDMTDKTTESFVASVDNSKSSTKSPKSETTAALTDSPNKDTNLTTAIYILKSTLGEEQDEASASTTGTLITIHIDESEIPLVEESDDGSDKDETVPGGKSIPDDEEGGNTAESTKTENGDVSNDDWELPLIIAFIVMAVAVIMALLLAVYLQRRRKLQKQKESDTDGNVELRAKTVVNGENKERETATFNDGAYDI